MADPSQLASLQVVIPAYKPPPGLGNRVEALLAAGFSRVLIVDYGSANGNGGQVADLPSHPGVQLVTLPVNQGKGAALKTAFWRLLESEPDCQGVVTVDADGQHLPDDAARVGEAVLSNPETLVLGSRVMSPDAPWRSRVGNRMTRLIYRCFCGQSVSDTQTGLRGIPIRQLRELTNLPGDGYEYEMQMLVHAAQRDWRVLEVPIATVYEDGNRTSHFRWFRDSMRIYCVLGRFTLASLLTAGLDMAVFALMQALTGQLMVSLVTGRITGLLFNFPTVRKLVFKSPDRVWPQLAKYMALALTILGLHYCGIQLLMGALGWGALPSRLVTESLLYVFSFAAQRRLIFAEQTGDRQVSEAGSGGRGRAVQP